MRLPCFTTWIPERSNTRQSPHHKSIHKNIIYVYITALHLSLNIKQYICTIDYALCINLPLFNVCMLYTNNALSSVKAFYALWCINITETMPSIIKRICSKCQCPLTSLPLIPFTFKSVS